MTEVIIVGCQKSFSKNDHCVPVSSAEISFSLEGSGEGKRDHAAGDRRKKGKEDLYFCFSYHSHVLIIFV